MNKVRISRYFRKVGKELAREFHLDGYYVITDRVGDRCLGVSIDRPTNSYEIHCPGFFTTDTQTYYAYIKV